mmetsp:Transcript_72636/g.128039  ORF Transcript_72636/g.128039 Transcript_72636/m.128039 type:complete len:94 (+) Transcript_72636:85-366(+)
MHFTYFREIPVLDVVMTFARHNTFSLRKIQARQPTLCLHLHVCDSNVTFNKASKRYRVSSDTQPFKRVKIRQKFGFTNSDAMDTYVITPKTQR